MWSNKTLNTNNYLRNGGCKTIKGKKEEKTQQPRDIKTKRNRKLSRDNIKDRIKITYDSKRTRKKNILRFIYNIFTDNLSRSSSKYQCFLILPEPVNICLNCVTGFATSIMSRSVSNQKMTKVVDEWGDRPHGLSFGSE